MTSVTLDLESASDDLLKVLEESPEWHVRLAAVEERKRRRKPRFLGPVRVEFSSWDDSYAFQSDIALAIGDRVIVETRYGDRAGTVTGYGTGSWDPRRHGALRPVLRRA